MHDLGKKNVLLSRDMLAKIAAEYPAVFDKIVEEVKK
jgi:ribosomal protein L20